MNVTFYSSQGKPVHAAANSSSCGQTHWFVADFGGSELTIFTDTREKADTLAAAFKSLWDPNEPTAEERAFIADYLADKEIWF